MNYTLTQVGPDWYKLQVEEGELKEAYFAPHLAAMCEQVNSLSRIAQMELVTVDSPIEYKGSLLTALPNTYPQIIPRKEVTTVCASCKARAESLGPSQFQEPEYSNTGLPCSSTDASAT